MFSTIFPYKISFKEENSMSNPNSALISFRFENVHSYRDEFIFSMAATRLAEKHVPREFPTTQAKPTKILPAAGIYGANASGKTNFLQAMDDMRRFVLRPLETVRRPIRRKPFLLEPETAKKPSHFRVDLLIDGVIWLYGFALDDEKIHSEFAYHYPKGRQALLFEREGESIRFGPSFRTAGKQLQKVTRADNLLLSMSGFCDYETLAPLYGWFRNNLFLADSSNLEERSLFTAHLLTQESSRKRVLQLLAAADLGVADAVMRFDQLPPKLAESLQQVLHSLEGYEPYDGAEKWNGMEAPQLKLQDLLKLSHATQNGPVTLKLEDESKGTLAWFGLVGKLIDAFEHGRVLLVDELDTSLHPKLIEEIVSMFQEEDINRRFAQLIFNTHDTVLLGDSSIRTLGRDQIWLVEKGEDGASEMFAVADFKTRNDEAMEFQYRTGSYGAAPNLSLSDLYFGVLPAVQ